MSIRKGAANQKRLPTEAFANTTDRLDVAGVSHTQIREKTLFFINEANKSSGTALLIDAEVAEPTEQASTADDKQCPGRRFRYCTSSNANTRLGLVRPVVQDIA